MAKVYNSIPEVMRVEKPKSIAKSNHDADQISKIVVKDELSKDE